MERGRAHAGRRRMVIVGVVWTFQGLGYSGAAR